MKVNVCKVWEGLSEGPSPHVDSLGDGLTGAMPVAQLKGARARLRNRPLGPDLGYTPPGPQVPPGPGCGPLTSSSSSSSASSSGPLASSGCSGSACWVWGVVSSCSEVSNGGCSSLKICCRTRAFWRSSHFLSCLPSAAPEHWVRPSDSPHHP